MFETCTALRRLPWLQPQAAVFPQVAKGPLPQSILVLGCRYLLPPIILYAGLSVKKKQFFRNVLTISAFGVLGTYIQFTIMALVLFGFSKLPNVLNFAVSG